MAPRENSSPWSKTVDQVLDFFKSDERGLSAEVAERRLEENGFNDFKREKTVHGVLIFLRQFKSPLVLVLVGASAVSYFLGETIQVVLILLMVLMSGILAFVQEYRSERALRLLRSKLTRYATVIRSGKPAQVDSRNLVLGDVVILEVGMVVSADLRLIKLDDLALDESMLTGESMPVEKSVDPLGGKKLLPQEQVNIAFMGTSVVQGSGIGVVVAVGMQTEMGRTAALLSEKTEETDYQKGVRSFGSFLLKITLGLVLFVALAMGVLRGDWIEAVLFGLALAVGISPELFPMIVTLNLSRGALKMSHRHVLVKRLIAIEDLGNADVLCTDKTGTLTVGKLRVRGGIDASGKKYDAVIAYASHCVTLNSHGRANNPVDQAILEAEMHEHLPDDLNGCERYETISFDFDRRRMSCVVGKNNSPRTLIVKGAVKEMLDVCDVSASHRHELLAMADRWQDQGYRLIAVARREIETKERYTPEDERDLELLGFVMVSDAPKQTARASLVALRKLNVRTVILTGDTERVTRHVAEQLCFEITGLVTGKQLEAVSAEELKSLVEKTNVFASITPEQKLMIIRALKECGHTVAYIGDGVNDAPSLRAADVGISFDNAVDVAKEAASVILLKNSLAVLADGIREGRRTFNNTQTFINATISSNFGNMLSLAATALFLPFVPMLPAQILLLNFLSDLPMLGISSDRASDEDLAMPRKWDIKRISRFTYFFGIISSVADFMTFGLLYFIARANIPLFRSGWFVESLITEVVIILLLRSRRTSLSNPPSKILAGMCVFAVLLAFVIVYTPLGSSIELVSLPLYLILSIFLIVIVYGALTEIGKRLFYHYLFKEKSMA
ncbi:MAG: magnesium-translocating P-type ATPase [Patescibacteria group bacterium]